MIMGAVQILGLVVLIIGILLIGVEFYLPGFGVPGIAGTVFTAAGIFLTGRNVQERVVVGIIAIDCPHVVFFPINHFKLLNTFHVQAFTLVIIVVFIVAQRIFLSFDS